MQGEGLSRRTGAAVPNNSEVDCESHLFTSARSSSTPFSRRRRTWPNLTATLSHDDELPMQPIHTAKRPWNMWNQSGSTSTTQKPFLPPPIEPVHPNVPIQIHGADALDDFSASTQRANALGIMTTQRGGINVRGIENETKGSRQSEMANPSYPHQPFYPLDGAPHYEQPFQSKDLSLNSPSKVATLSKSPFEEINQGDNSMETTFETSRSASPRGHSQRWRRASLPMPSWSYEERLAKGFFPPWQSRVANMNVDQKSQSSPATLSRPTMEKKETWGSSSASDSVPVDRWPKLTQTPGASLHLYTPQGAVAHRFKNMEYTTATPLRAAQTARTNVDPLSTCRGCGRIGSNEKDPLGRKSNDSTPHLPDGNTLPATGSLSSRFTEEVRRLQELHRQNKNLKLVSINQEVRAHKEMVDEMQSSKELLVAMGLWAHARQYLNDDILSMLQ